MTRAGGFLLKKVWVGTYKVLSLEPAEVTKSQAMTKTNRSCWHRFAIITSGNDTATGESQNHQTLHHRALPTNNVGHRCLLVSELSPAPLYDILAQIQSPKPLPDFKWGLPQDFSKSGLIVVRSKHKTRSERVFLGSFRNKQTLKADSFERISD